MSGKNGGGHDFGALLGGIAALITALVVLLVYLGIQPKQSGQSSPSTESSGSPSFAPQPSESPTSGSSPNSLCPSKMTFSELYDFNSRNPLQAKDVCENQTLTLIGYLNSNSIYECPYQNELKETVQGRCLRIFHDKQFFDFYGTTIFQYTEHKKDLLIELNKSLYQNGNHTVTIQAEVSFKKNETSAADYSFRQRQNSLLSAFE
jgi:hypothetical protein